MNSKSPAAKKNKWITIDGVIARGHHVASRKSKEYPRGTIVMQKPFFKKLGLDLSGYKNGTLNVSIAPKRFVMGEAEHAFKKVAWTTLHPPEDFSFSRCVVVFKRKNYEGWIYYPHPETKARHFQNASIVEVIAVEIPGIGYGDAVKLKVKSGEAGVE